MGKIVDMTGQRYGMLTVIKRVENDKHGKAQWLCKCDCGSEKTIVGASLRRGLTVSCGCWSAKKRQEYNESQEIDETGNKYGKLLVLEKYNEPIENKDKRARWICQCDCGNKVIVAGKSLRNGHTKSCGCLVFQNKIDKGTIIFNDKGGIEKIDLTGEKFGKLTVLEKIDDFTKWKCVCECGGTTIATRYNLLNGHTQSCGCIKSIGEETIMKILSSNNINVIREYRISLNKKDISYFKFDFAIIEDEKIKYCIEYDGSQHFEARETGWATEENLLKTKERDAIKNQWCKENNIPLIRIPYTHLNNLELKDLLLETTSFLVK